MYFSLRTAESLIKYPPLVHSSVLLELIGDDHPVQLLFVLFYLYPFNLRLSCTTSAAAGPVMGPIQLMFRDATGANRTVQSVQLFSFRDLAITAVSPIAGIEAGGTVLTLSGLSLLVGSTHRVTVGGQECAVVRWVGQRQGVCT